MRKAVEGVTPSRSAELVETGVSVAFQDNEGAELGDCDRVLDLPQRTGGDPDQCA